MRSIALLSSYCHLPPRRLVHAQSAASPSSAPSQQTYKHQQTNNKGQQKKKMTKTERVTSRYQFGTPFKLPRPIKRGPTEILETLRDATILEDDPTSRPRGASYDDPLLTPGSQDMERQNAFAMEFGKRTARLIAEEYPTLFMYGMDEPKMEYFQIRPNIPADTDTRDTEEELMGVIREGRVENAIKIWENAESAENPIGNGTRQALLELLCFYNSQKDETFTESPHIFERYYRTFLLQNEIKKDRWKTNGEAEMVFESMGTEKTGKAYSALIAGMTARGKENKAMDLYKQAKTDGLKLTVEAINGLIAVGGGQLSEDEPSDPHKLWTKALELAGEVNKPNLQTFNSLLSLLTRMRSWDESQLHSTEVFQEMEHVGLKPSGHTFLLLWTIYSEDKRLYKLIDSCLDRLLSDKANMEVRDEEDRLFFPRAMAMCHDSFSDPRLSLKLHQLFRKGRNRGLITDGLSDQSYHHHFLSSILPVDPDNPDQLSVDDFFEHYFKIVPKYLMPNPDVMNCIVKDIILPRGEFQFLPRIWNHILTLGHVYKRMTMAPYLEALYVGLRTMDQETEEFKTFQQHAAKIIEGFVNVMDLQDNVAYYQPNLPWNPDMLTYCALCFAHCDQFILSWVMMERLERYLKHDDLSVRRPSSARGGQQPQGSEFVRNRPENSRAEMFEIGRVTDNLMWQLFRQYQENGLPKRALRLVPIAQQLNLRRDLEQMRGEVLRQERNAKAAAAAAAADSSPATVSGSESAASAIDEASNELPKQKQGNSISSTGSVAAAAAAHPGRAQLVDDSRRGQNDDNNKTDESVTGVGSSSPSVKKRSGNSMYED